MDMPVVLLHGWLHSGEIWGQVKALDKKGLTFHSPDLPGFGNVPPPDEQEEPIVWLTIFVQRYLQGVFDLHGPCVVIADSLSGIIMLNLLTSDFLQDVSVTRKQESQSRLPGAHSEDLTFSSRTDQNAIRHLVLLGTPVDGLPAFVHRLRKTIPLKLLIDSFKVFPIGITQAMIRYGNHFTMHNRTVELGPLISGLRQADSDFSVRLFDDLMSPYEPRKIQNPENIPVTVLRGRHDKIVSAKSSRQLAHLLDASYKEIPDSGHTPMLENPQALLSIIYDILESKKN